MIEGETMRQMSATLLNLVFYLWLIALGAGIGAKALRGIRMVWLSRLQMAVLFMIILSLGIQLGANEEVAESVGIIGLAALISALLAMAGSLLFGYLLRRFLLKLDRFGSAGGESGTEADSGGSADTRLTWVILAAVIVGAFLGRAVLPEAVTRRCAPAVSLGLDVMLFLVGLDLGVQGESIRSMIRDAGARPLLLPLAVVAGSLSFGALTALVLPFSPRETAAVAAGMGWYSLAPSILAPYSLKLSAIAFLSNIIRELLSILLVPFVARRIGYLESVAIAGATAMDTLLPVILKAADRRITVYAFTSGLVCSLLVPVLVPLMIAF